ncbi:MAG: HD domain-containing protein [Clostridiales bacterium]|nr:HD domain-containing protein [Clostridiales bacterium]
MMEETPKQDAELGLQNAIANTVADLVEFRDNSTGWHVSRTQKYLKTLVGQMHEDGVYSDEVLSWDMDAILPSAQFHDVGKISISDAILNKPGKLAPEEFEIMKTHVQRGVEAIEKMERFGYFMEFLEHAKTIAGTHHEKWDGSGYPRGLSGLGIPLLGRLMAVVDVYDALTSVRPYKKAFSAEESAQIIINGAGTHFDPAIICVFRKLIDEFAAIAKKDI